MLGAVLGQVPDVSVVVLQLESRCRITDADVNDFLIGVVGGRRAYAQQQQGRQEPTHWLD